MGAGRCMIHWGLGRNIFASSSLRMLHGVQAVHYIHGNRFDLASVGCGATFVKWCGLLLNTDTLELQGDYTRCGSAGEAGLLTAVFVLRLAVPELLLGGEGLQRRMQLRLNFTLSTPA